MRFIINIAMKTGMIILLNWLGWLTLMSSGHPATGNREIIGTAIAAAVIFTIVAILTILLSLGLAVILFIFLGGATLAIMHAVAPGFIALNHNFWLTVLSGFLILVASLPKKERVNTARARVPLRP